MGRRKWTTDEQGTWLAGYLDQFIDSQQTKTTAKEFFPKVLKEWHKAWPVSNPTQEELAGAKSSEDAVKKKKMKEDDRVKVWFHNHTRGQTFGSGSRGLLKLRTAKPRVRLEWQIYQQMTYESKWKAIIDKEWSAFTKKWEAENPETKMTETRFTFMNTFLQEKYREESDDVKAEVRKRRAELKEEVAGDEGEVELDVRNQAYQKAIDKLPKTLATIGESIQQQTGWNISFLVGGPEPGQNGRITTYMLHCGKSADNQNFEEFLGNEGYDTHIVGPFDDFLHESFSEDVLDSMSLRFLGSKETTPEHAEGEAEQGNGRVDAERSRGKDKIEVKSKKSHYELTREANIVKNMEVLQEIGERYPAPEDLKPEPVRKATKAKGKKKGNDEPIRTSARLARGSSNKPTEEQGQGTDHTPTSPSEGDAKLDSPPPADFDASTRDGTALPGSTSSSLLVPVGTNDVASAPSVTEALASSDPNPSASSLTFVDNHQGNVVPMDVDGVNGAAAPTSVDDHQGKSVPLEVDTPTSPECDAKLDSPPPADFDASTREETALPGTTSSSLLVPAGTDDVASAPSVTEALASLDPKPSASSMDVDTANGAVLPPSLTSVENHQGNIVPMDVDDVNGAAAPTSVDDHQGKSVPLEVDIKDETASPPTPKTVSKTVVQVGDPVNSVDASNLPAWLISNGRLDYLRGVSEEGGWQNLVASLLKFEIENKVMGNLPTTSRPKVIAAWIKSKKKDVMPEVNADEYGSSFMAWWIAIQPKWRLADDSSFVYSTPAGEDWRFLHKGGSSGLYIVVVALSWWVNALTPGESQLRLSKAIHDVTWVIDQIYKIVLPASNGNKRGHEDAEKSGNAKRRRAT